MLKVKPTGLRGHMATRSGRNISEIKNVRKSISRKPSEVEPWLLKK